MLVLDHGARRNVSPMASYFQEINDATLLTQENEHELAWRVQEGDVEARDQMVKANLRLVVAIARRYVNRGLCLSDLIQEGNLGLVHAVERFDPSQNTRFSTYAKFWIQEALGKALEKMAAPVRIPAYANDLMCNWHRAVNELHEDLSRPPLDEEVAVHLHLSPRQLAIVQKARRIHNHPPQQAPEDETATRAVVDSQTPAPDAHLAANDEVRHVFKLLNKLPDREATILRLRFGLGGQNPMTLLEVGQRLDLTRERVRQLEKGALAKLRDLVGDAA